MLGWQFHDYDVEYVRDAIIQAEEMGVNAIVLSHGLVYYTDQILEDEQRAKDLAFLIDTAHAHGMKAFIWVHELNAVPENLLKDGKVDFDNPGLFQWLREKYSRLLKILPQIDGIILTLRETPYKVFKSDVIESTLPPWDRIAKLCNTINSVLRDAGKTLIVRTFLYEPWELEWMMLAFPIMDKDIVIMSKCVPHDWQPFYPPNPVLGRTSPHPQIMELDLACEAGGVDVIPYCQVDEVKRWVDYARERGLYGIIARVDFGSRHALGGLNEINLYALSQFFHNPKNHPDQVWRSWCKQKYGERAAPYVERALRRSTDIVKKTTYVLTFWVSKHHNLPSYKIPSFPK